MGKTTSGVQSFCQHHALHTQEGATAELKPAWSLKLRSNLFITTFIHSQAALVAMINVGSHLRLAAKSDHVLQGI